MNSSGVTLAAKSCGRCQSKKIRCNRATPRCDRCEASGVECVYSPRKPRTKKQGPDVTEKGLLLEVLDRLKRLEDHCGLDKPAATQDDGNDSMSISSLESGTRQQEEAQAAESPESLVPAAVLEIVNKLKDEDSKSMLLSNVLCHLRQIESCFFENEQCMRAITSALSEIEFMHGTQIVEPQVDPIEVPKDLAKKFIENYYTHYQFEGFKMPLERSFLTSIPDLIEIPHIQLDCTSQIIYYTVILQGIVLEPQALPKRGKLIRNLYLKCVSLSDEWLENIQDTPADFFASLTLISMALEGCNIDLAWKALSQACRISKALGYFAVDETPSPNTPVSPLLDPILQQQQQHPASAESAATGETPDPNSTSPAHIEAVNKNRQRFEFWHLLRTDCVFRMSFGKPPLIPAGSWKVNFPDPSITGAEHESSRFIQIHFLASMRLALIYMKYLDWIDYGVDSEPDEGAHDASIAGFIDEVQAVLEDWDTDNLLKIANNHIDIWFCVDVLFSSYKMLIILYQSKKCNRGPILPPQAVSIARKSTSIFQSLLASSLHAFWGISLVLLHQLIPFFTLCLDVIGNPDHENLDEDLVSITWISDYVEMVVEERVELTPILIIMKAMATACKRVRMERIAVGQLQGQGHGHGHGHGGLQVGGEMRE